jgi:hypothetical protein
LNVLISRDAKIADQLLSLTARELSRKQDQVLLLSRSAEERVICFLIEMSKRISPKDYLIALPMTRQHIADYLGLTIETISRILHDLERRGAIKIKGYRSIALRNQFVEGRAEELPDLFEGIKGQSGHRAFGASCPLLTQSGHGDGPFGYSDPSRSKNVISF